MAAARPRPAPRAPPRPAPRVFIRWRRLHDETERINTFLDHFPNGGVRQFSHFKLAALGFAYIKELKAITCVFCRKCAPYTIDRDNSEGTMENIHAQLSPYCPMVTGTRCRNKPLYLRQEYLDRLFRTPRHLAIDIPIAGVPWHRLNKEKLRLRTFYNHPTITPETAYRFTQFGFVYISSQNSVTCAFCGESLENNDLAQLGDISAVMAAHEYISPNCPMVTGERCLNLPVVPHFVTNTEDHILGSRLPINPNDPVSLTLLPGEARRFDFSGANKDSGINTNRPVHHFPRRTRALTFKLLNINAEPLIDQGFFYEDQRHEDRDPQNPPCCICHWCGYAFDPVQYTNDFHEIPVRHALIFPGCPAVKAYTPQSFIDVVHELQADLDQSGAAAKVKLADVFNELRSRNIHAQLGLEPPSSVYPDYLERDPAVTFAVERFGWSQEDAVRGAKLLLDESLPIDADEINTKLENLEIDGVKPVRVNYNGANPGFDPGSSQTLEEYESQAAELANHGSSQTPEEKKRREAELKASMKKIKDKIEEMRVEQLCKCCYSKQADTLVFPCQHRAICNDCSLAMKKCLICRQQIQGRVQQKLTK